MENYELYHYGTKDMRWGIRRYQNPDGSLTEAGKKRYARLQRKEARKEAKAKRANEKKAIDIEKKRAELLKSSDAAELYKHRDLLTTNELNERLTRIDTERRLKDAKTNQVISKVDKALKYGNKINEVYEFTQKPAMKALMKKLGVSKPEEKKKFDLNKALGNLDNMSDTEVANLSNRLKNYNSVKATADKLTKAASDAKGTASKTVADKLKQVASAPSAVNKATSDVKNAVDTLAKNETVQNALGVASENKTVQKALKTTVKVISKDARKAMKSKRVQKAMDEVRTVKVNVRSEDDYTLEDLIRTGKSITVWSN